ncbi:MAG: hypothetical protein OXC91_00845 [Rhodobacteraceae bacterium]|nr:hypothetical protein [Paracoccaceae bacterium]
MSGFVPPRASEMKTKLTLISSLLVLTGCGSIVQEVPVRVTELQACPVSEISPPVCPAPQIYQSQQGRFVSEADWLICSAIADAWQQAWRECAEAVSK